MPVRAAVLSAPGARLRIGTLLLDEPEFGEVLVRTLAAGLCHSDLMYISGAMGIETPAVLGHEVAGVVERLGDGVTRLAVGDLVVATVTPSCGSCAMCVSGHPTQCQRVEEKRRRSRPLLVDEHGDTVTSLGAIGAFAERMVLPEAMLAVLDPDIDPKVACLLGCCISTGVGAVVHGAQVGPADSVVVVGCGGVGMAAIQGSRIAGARRIIAVDLHPAKLALALQLGATDAVIASSPDARMQVLAICPDGVSHAFEAVGNSATAEFAFSVLAPGGTATILGLMPSGTRISFDAQALIEGDRRIQGAYMGGNQFLADISMLIDHATTGQLDLESMVTSIVALEDINDGFDLMKAPAAIRTVIDFTRPRSD